MQSQMITGPEAALMMIREMQGQGIHPVNPGKLVADLQSQELVRFQCTGERNKNGWAVLRLGGGQGGSFGNWRLGVTGSWRAAGATSMSAHAASHIAPMQMQDLAKSEQAYEEAAAKAREIWSKSHLPIDHDYLTQKALFRAARSIHPSGRSINVRQFGTRLIVPLGTTATPLCSLQSIAENGNKRFLPGGRVAGAFWRAGFTENMDTIAVGEGFGTMAAVHMATGLPVAAAMSAGNLKRVVGALYGRYAAITLVVCADMDVGRNVGLAEANAAAAMVPGALVAKPPLPPGWPPQKGWDFADVWLAKDGDIAIGSALGVKDCAHA